MKTYLTYKNEIQGFKDVAATIKAKEQIAASSVHFLKNEVANLHNYTKNIENILVRLSAFYQKKDHLLLKKNKTGKKAIIIITADKGLVGNLWHDIINTFLQEAKSYYTIISVGTKGKKYLGEEKIPVAKSFNGFTDISQQGEINSFTNYVFDEFKQKRISEINILYPQFISLAEYKPIIIPFLPFKFDINEDEVEEYFKRNTGLPIFEPAKHKIFSQLLQKYISVYFYRIILESKLVEFSARTIAMDHAESKTKELIYKFISSFRKDRRRLITQQQLESFTAHKVKL